MAETSPFDAPFQILTENAESIEAACPDEVMSVTTEGSNWCFVEMEKGEMPQEDELKSDSEEAENDENETDSDSSELDISVEQISEVQVSPSALLLSFNAFELGHPLLSQCAGHGGDITDSWAKALEGFPAVPSIFCLGRLAVSPSDTTSGSLATVPVTARCAVFNHGPCTWPEATALRIVAGDPLGLDHLPCGGLPPKCGAELVLDLAVPTAGPGGSGGRSAWVLTDGNGEPFGPILVVEVMWT